MCLKLSVFYEVGGLCREGLLLEGKGIAQAGSKHFKNKFTEPKGVWRVYLPCRLGLWAPRGCK